MHEMQQEYCGGQGGTAFNWSLRARNPNAASGSTVAAASHLELEFYASITLAGWLERLLHKAPASVRRSYGALK
jgi:hypothetical protein